MAEVDAPKYVPFDQVAEWTDRASVDHLQLPAWFDRDQFGINLGRLERVANWYGLGTVALASYSGKTTGYSPEVVGIDGHGTAVAGRLATVVRPDTFRHTAREADGEPEYRHPDVTIAVNNPAIDEQLQHKRVNLRDAKARAKLLDKAVRKGLQTCANKQVLNSFAIFKSAAGYPFAAALEFLFFHPNGVDKVALNTWAIGATYNGFHAIIELCRYRIDPAERNWSLFMGVPFDRLAVANGLAKATRLIKALR